MRSSWWLQYSVQLQYDLLSKQFWIDVGREVTAAGLQRAHYQTAQAEQDTQGEDGEMPAVAPSHSAAADAAAADACPALPYPMYPPSMQQLLPAELTPQHLYHLIDGECQNLRQR